MNVIFRVDSSSEMGHGHLMRCLALAQELSWYDVPIHFICRDNGGSAHDLVVAAGHELHLLPGKKITTKSTHYKDWLGAPQAEDASACNNIIAGLSNCHVIVDHYGLDIEWESRILCQELTVIDDLADRAHQCSRVIDQSLIHTKEDYKPFIRGEFEFWGGSSIILRDEFRKSAEWKNVGNGTLLLCMGGADPQGITTCIVKALLNSLENLPSRKKIKHLDIVIGQGFDHQQELEQALFEASLDVTVHQGHPNISSLTANATISILSCGTMILEACALGAPAIGVPLAENQKGTASFLAKNKAILPLSINEELEGNLSTHLENALGTGNMLPTLSQHAKMMVNKNATLSIAQALNNSMQEVSALHNYVNQTVSNYVNRNTMGVMP